MLDEVKSHQHIIRNKTNSHIDHEDEEVNREAYQLTHRLIQNACIFAHPTMSGFNTVHNACVNIFIPMAPPGKNVTKYHINDNNCNTDAPNTKIYPSAPPTVNVKYNVIIILPRYITVKWIRSYANIL